MLFDDMSPLLDKDLNEPKYNQLARQIETYLKNQSVPTGTRLPSGQAVRYCTGHGGPQSE